MLLHNHFGSQLPHLVKVCRYYSEPIQNNFIYWGFVIGDDSYIFSDFASLIFCNPDQFNKCCGYPFISDYPFKNESSSKKIKTPKEVFKENLSQTGAEVVELNGKEEVATFVAKNYPICILTLGIGFL